MGKINNASLILFLLLTLGLGACGGDEYYTDDYLRNSDDKLCGRDWVETYEVNDGADLCTHILFFNANHRGKETHKYQKINSNGSLSDFYKSQDKSFDWRWLDDKMEGLMLDYIDEGTINFDNVWVRENYLSGKLRGQTVTFKKE